MIAGIISVQLAEDLASLHAALGRALHKLIELVRRSPRGHRRRDKSHLLAPDFMQKLETIPGRHIRDIGFRLNPLEVNISLQIHIKSVECVNNPCRVWDGGIAFRHPRCCRRIIDKVNHVTLSEPRRQREECTS